MNDTDLNKETDKHDNLSPHASIPDADHEPQSDKPDAETDKVANAAASITDSPNISEKSDNPHNPDTSISDMKVGTGAGMSDAVMTNSINASDGDAINNNLEALASGRMTLHIGA
ncbi:hypothetical protein [Candidatus Puniceispirillum marinum]|uniref:Dentin sialophosphoprotein n=1 Tax=Puniceispirillum marinum (strain IMCC1322) TaxID=488538 RepID=D5BP62_PUNMI|nr:hypothetical protein [Candidatus Puniceispirillum marinum]ADE40496.1 dentin sialophosphoprotein [Candidatus Puniceispirillum marinum IMCC1322]